MYGHVPLGLVSHVHERSRARGTQAQAAIVLSPDAGANVVEGEKRAIRLARIFKN